MISIGTFVSGSTDINVGVLLENGYVAITIDTWEDFVRLQVTPDQAFELVLLLSKAIGVANGMPVGPPVAE